MNITRTLYLLALLLGAGIVAHELGRWLLADAVRLVALVPVLVGVRVLWVRERRSR